MEKKEYFKLIREVMKTVRRKGLSYIRVFSEPRKKTGYRTKVYMATSELCRALKMAEHIKTVAPYGLTVEVIEGFSMWNAFGDGGVGYSVVLRPINKVISE